jgi:hypothetical protein
VRRSSQTLQYPAIEVEKGMTSLTPLAAPCSPGMGGRQGVRLPAGGCRWHLFWQSRNCLDGFLSRLRALPVTPFASRFARAVSCNAPGRYRLRLLGSVVDRSLRTPVS